MAQRPWWDGSEDLARIRQADEAAERVQAVLAADDARRFVRTVVNAFGRSIGWGLGRRFLAAIFGRG